MLNFIIKDTENELQLLYDELFKIRDQFILEYKKNLKKKEKIKKAVGDNNEQIDELIKVEKRIHQMRNNVFKNARRIAHSIHEKKRDIEFLINHSEDMNDNSRKKTLRFDEQIKKNIVDKLFRNNKIDLSGVTVEVTDGKATLHGTVPSYDAQISAISDVWSLSAVKDIRNSINVDFSEKL